MINKISAQTEVQWQHHTLYNKTYFTYDSNIMKSIFMNLKTNMESQIILK